LRHRLTEARLKIINQVAGVVLVAFGVVLFTQLAWSFAGHSRIAFGALRPSV
jgi:hypothetical protein